MCYARPVESLRDARPAAAPPPYSYNIPNRGRRPRKPLPAERARGRGVFHGILGYRRPSLR